MTALDKCIILATLAVVLVALLVDVNRVRRARTGGRR